MSTTQIQLPQEAIKLLEEIREKHPDISLEDLKNEVIKKFNTSKFFQTDTSKTLEEKLVFCAKTIKGEYQNLIRFDPYNIIPTGFGPIRVTKAGVKRSDIHVWTKEKEKDVLRSISFTDSDLDKYSQIQLNNLYKGVKLGKFSSGDFSSDHRTQFKDPNAINMTSLQIFEKLGVKRCKISDVLSNISKEEGGFTKTTDVRIIRGIIIKHAKGVKKTDSGVDKEWAYYDIFDNSLEGDFTDPDGVTITPIFRVWVHPLWMIYEKDNQIDFIGSITVYNKGVSMNGYTLIPAYTPSGKLTEA